MYVHTVYNNAYNLCPQVLVGIVVTGQTGAY